MDKEEAMFILENYRPGMTDMTDPLVIEALAMVAEDAALAAWLADVRVSDVVFADALKSAPLPDGLREGIVAGIAARRADLPEPADDFDTMMMRDLVAIRTPSGLRSRVLVAMERSVARRRSIIPWRRIMLPLAGAAGIVLALIWESERDVAVAVHAPPLSADVVQAGFIRAYESPLFALDERQNDHRLLIQALESKGLPCPCCLPPGLEKGVGIGCRELIIEGRRGSVICFDDRENGTVHLVVFKARDLRCKLPDMDKPSIVRQGPWVAARWIHGDHAYLLIGSSNEERLAKLF